MTIFREQWMKVMIKKILNQIIPIRIILKQKKRDQKIVKVGRMYVYIFNKIKVNHTSLKENFLAPPVCKGSQGCYRSLSNQIFKVGQCLNSIEPSLSLVRPLLIEFRMWSSMSNGNYNVSCYFWGWVNWEKMRWFVVTCGGSWGCQLRDCHESGHMGQV